jgi:uncharacterized membrane protein YphA (DoxX/SURF4 family)
MKSPDFMGTSDLYHGVFRITIGVYWLYFASQKWQGVGWMQPLIQKSAAVNPIPGLHEFLVQVVAPNWLPFAIAQSIAETLVAVLLILGLATRKASLLGLLLSINLALTVAYLIGPDTAFRWLYYLAVLVNAQLFFSEAGIPALGRLGFIPGWLKD